MIIVDRDGFALRFPIKHISSAAEMELRAASSQ